ncbi:transposable element Tc1 transposase [Trichonephila clavipes]|nr:transposable element Tc1 transposase [Trichonephila clavipes]
MNPTSNCILTFIEDLSGDAQGSVPNLFSLLHATQALNQELWSGVRFLLTQDNAKPHMEPITINCLTDCKTLPSPARSIDIYPIQHVQDMKGRRLRLPGTVDPLARQLEQIWQEIPQETIRVPYHSMPHRVAACIQATGVGQLFNELFTL